MTVGSNIDVLFMAIWLLGNCNRVKLVTSPKVYNFGSFWLKLYYYFCQPLTEKKLGLDCKKAKMDFYKSS